MTGRMLAFTFAAALALPGQEQILDRIAVTVGNHVITEGEVYDQMRLTSFLNGEKPDFNAEEKRKAAERLIDQYLIKKEMQINSYPEPETDEAGKMLAQLIRQRFGTRDRYEAALKEYGVTDASVKANLLWQLTALRFTDLRFRPDIRQEGTALREHLEKHTEERTSAQAGAPPKADRGEPKTDNAEDYGQPPEQREKAERQALPPSVDQQMTKWLDDARSRARVEYRKDVFQ